MRTLMKKGINMDDNLKYIGRYISINMGEWLSDEIFVQLVVLQFDY